MVQTACMYIPRKVVDWWGMLTRKWRQTPVSDIGTKFIAWLNPKTIVTELA